MYGKPNTTSYITATISMMDSGDKEKARDLEEVRPVQIPFLYSNELIKY
jgi:hypothetical protein